MREAKNTEPPAVAEDSCRIVLVALAGEQLPLQNTLDCIAEVGGETPTLELLAANTSELRALAEAHDIEASFTLPAQVDSGHLICTILESLDYKGDPLILLRGGCQVPESWCQRLYAAGKRNPRAMAISPVSARHPLLKAFPAPVANPGLGADAVDQWLNDYAMGREFDVPVIAEGCAYLAGADWPELLRAAEADDLKLFVEARKRGFGFLACDHLYVDDSTVPGLGSVVNQLPEAVSASLAQAHTLLNWRHPLSELASRGEEPSVSTRSLPVQLHIAHSWGGGLGRWVDDYIKADRHHHNLVLRPVGDWSAFGKTIALYRGAEMDVALASWTLAYPIVSTVIASHQYREILEQVIREYRVESLLVSSLIGASLEVLQTGLPTLMVLHDYFPYCPALVATFDAPCESCDAEKHARCMENNPHHRYFLHEDADHWDFLREHYLPLLAKPELQLAAPSESVASRFRQLVGGVDGKTVNVIRHGLAEDMIVQLSAVRQRPPGGGARLNVTILGSLAPQKGSALLDEILESLTEFADLSLIGCGEEGSRYADRPGLRVVPFFNREDLPQLLVESRCELGLLLSVVPETFSYTLSEFWAAGIPVLATRIGAFADRVEEGRSGWLAEPDPDSVMAVIERLAGDRSLISAARAHLCERTERDSVAMADDYHALLPVNDGFPARYLLARRTYRNRYRDYEQNKALHINHHLPYRQILCEFLEYSYQKSLHSPRINGWQRGILSGALLWVIQRLRRNIP